MQGCVDIHAHILPGIDDGPGDVGESLAMARAAAESGTAVIVATPHLRVDFPAVHVDQLAERCEALRETIRRAGVQLEIVAGAEVSLPWALEASDEELALASYGQRGTDLLIETPMMNAPAMDRLLPALRMKGYRVTLGHPERSRHFRRDEDRLRRLAADGVLLQLNADSLLGAAGRGAQRLARKLLTDGVAHVIGSDGHRATGRRPVTQLARAAQVVAQLAGPERAGWMTQAVPSAILEGADVPDPPVVVPQPWHRGRFGFGRR
jgi:protein-tyrosine phosphatase